MLTLQIKEKEIENLTPEEEFVRGTVGAKCQINFDEFWQGYEKYIVFKRVGYEPINLMVDTLENEIEIPYTILAESGEFKIGVFGTTETETLPTLYSKDIKILYGTDTHGTTPPTYIPSEIDQLRLSKQDKLVSGENIKTINNQSILGSGNITIEGSSSITVDQTYSPDSENAQSGKAVAEAVSDKQDSLVSGTNIKTINNQSILGSGNITIEGGSDVEVDQNYNPTSENAQSGKAVAEAVAPKLNNPNTEGEAGQILGLDTNLLPQWTNKENGFELLADITAEEDVTSFSIPLNGIEYSEFILTLFQPTLRPEENWVGLGIANNNRDAFPANMSTCMFMNAGGLTNKAIVFYCKLLAESIFVFQNDTKFKPAFIGLIATNKDWETINTPYFGQYNAHAVIRNVLTDIADYHKLAKHKDTYFKLGSNGLGEMPAPLLAGTRMILWGKRL